MPLGTEVGCGPGDIVLDGDPAPPRKGAQQPPPTFRPMYVVAKRSTISATALFFSFLVPCGRLSWLYICFPVYINAPLIVFIWLV